MHTSLSLVLIMPQILPFMYTPGSSSRHFACWRMGILMNCGVYGFAFLTADRLELPLTKSVIFLTYINDLTKFLSSPVRPFADDCVIYRAIKTSDDHRTLQNDLNINEQWCNNLQMSLNMERFKLLTCTRRTTSSYFS